VKPTSPKPLAPLTRADVLVVFSLWLLVFAASSQVMIIAPILPRIGAALDISEELQGTLVTGYAVSLAAFALLIGPISDRYGRRAVLLAGSGSMMAALGLHVLAVDYWSMLALRVLAGGAGGMLTGAAVSYVGDYFPYARRGWANGWVMSGFAVGQVLAIPIGTILASEVDFRAPFLIFGAFMGASFLLILVGVPQPEVERDDQPLTILGALRGYGRAIRNPTVAAGCAAFFLMFMHGSLYVTFLPTWLERELGATVTQVASLFLVGGLANILTGPQAGRLSDRVGRKPLIVASCFGLAFWVLSTTFWVTDVWHAYLLFFVALVLVATRVSPFQTLLSSVVPSRQRGTTLSLVVAVGQVGGGIGGAIAGIVYPRAGMLGTAAAASLAIFACGVIVVLAIREPEFDDDGEPI